MYTPVIKYCPNKVCREDATIMMSRRVESFPLSRIYLRDISEKKYEYNYNYEYVPAGQFLLHLNEVSQNLKENKEGPTDTWKRNTKIVRRTRHKQLFKSIGWFCTYCKTTYLDEDISDRYTGPEIRNRRKIIKNMV